jgi:hypothetical protein
MKKLTSLLLVCVLTGTLSGCGGGSSSASATAAPPGVVSGITGVATPSAISVVTAK